MPKIIEKELGLTKLLQKQNGAILGGHSVEWYGLCPYFFHYCALISLLQTADTVTFYR